MNDETKTITLTQAQADALSEYASEFNLTIQGAFIEMMRKMHDLDLEDDDEARILIGNYGPLALGAALAAIVERYEGSMEKEFWHILMRKYAEGRTVLEGAMEDEKAAEDRGVRMVEMVPTVLDKNTTKH